MTPIVQLIRVTICPAAADKTYEVMVTQKLIQAIDGNRRTIPNRYVRSLVGSSLGAVGAMRYVALHPYLYCNTMPMTESGVDDLQPLL